MYLSDNGIRSLLESINFDCRLPGHDFDPEVQIGGASVDLRVDNVFWTTKPSRPRVINRVFRSVGRNSQASSRGIIDLRSSSLYEAQPQLHWQKRELQLGETLILRPGEMVMSRTYEEFTIPPGHAGKLSARISYSRMGLLVHCGGDFMNPGWRGHQPLQLVNLTGLSIRIMPLISVAQLSFVRLTELSSRLYGVDERYMFDDGGPSKWWRDALVRRLIDEHGEDNLPRPVSVRVNELIRREVFTDDQLERLVHFKENTPTGHFSTGDALIEEFVEVEKKRSTRRRLANVIGGMVAPAVVAGTFLGSLFVPWGILNWLMLGLLLLSVTGAILVAISRPDNSYFSSSDWRAILAAERSNVEGRDRSGS